MPTTYAHYRFGCDVLKRLPARQKAVIEAHRPLFGFGVHGPDLLFYYKPLSQNSVNQLGYASHRRTGTDFFTQAVQTVQRAPDREAASAYLYGVLCHFTLDRECHPYVGEKEKTGVSHSAIEASFDRFLMEKDGRNPMTFRPTGHLLPSRDTASVIAPFYPPLSAEDIFAAEKSMKQFLNLLASSGVRRSALTGLIRLSGHASLTELFLPDPPNPLCADSDRILFDRYQGAVRLAKTLFSQLEDTLDGVPSLGGSFDHTFGEA